MLWRFFMKFGNFSEINLEALAENIVTSLSFKIFRLLKFILTNFQQIQQKILSTYFLLDQEKP